MNGILMWLLLIAVLVTLFVVSGGLQSRVSIIVFVIAAVAGVMVTFFLKRRR